MGSSCEKQRSDAMLRAYIEPIENFLESDGPVQDILNKIADKTGISKRYIAAGSSMIIFWLLFGLLAPLTISLIAFTYPAIQSIRSLEEKQNQEKWLTYWVVYGVFNIVEFFSDILLSWFPLLFHQNCIFNLVHGSYQTQWFHNHIQNDNFALFHSSQREIRQIPDKSRRRNERQNTRFE